MSENVFFDIENINEIKEYINSPRKFIENFCYITTKGAEFKLLKLNKAQSMVMDYVEECLREKRPVRVRILKSRQLGMSTFISALGFWWATMNEYSSYAVVAHKEDSTRSIFDKNRIFYENLPVSLRPKTNRFNSESISYDYINDGEKGGGLKSKIFFGTAGGSELFRGETILFMHKSEKAFWENVDILNKSLNATVPTLPFTAIFDETTANGYNHFKDEWDASIRGENNYKPFFFGWDVDDTCVMEVEEGFKLMPIEEEYMLINDLTLEQMRWRRYKITNDFGYTLKDIELNEIDDFKQEYPLTPEEAFISSGGNVFNKITIEEGIKYAKNVKILEKRDIESVPMSEKLYIYEYPEIEEITDYDQVAEFSEEEQKYIYVDTDLIVGVRYRFANYLIAIDTSGSGQDRNVISVWHTAKKRKVAQWIRKTISEELLAKVAVEVAKIYNNAMIAPEVNFSHSLVGFIVDVEGYKNLYIMENFTRVDKRKETIEYGWHTNTATKPLLVSNMKKALNEDPTILPDIECWREIEYYMQKKSPSGKDIFEPASKKHHDDVLMSSMIGRFLCDSFMVNQGYTTTRNKDFFKLPKQKDILNDIIKGGSGWTFENQAKKSNKLKKGVFRNNA